jgi:hypothetical protein
LIQPLGAPRPLGPAGTAGENGLREVFHQFVGETFYTRLLSSMRDTVGKPAYLHGGRAEEAFQAQLDQVLAQKMTAATHNRFSDSLFQLFQLNRQS